MMDTLRIRLSELRSKEYLSSTPTQRATWLQLLLYCEEHNTQGVIDNAWKWTDRTWNMVCKITGEEVRQECDLFAWENGHLYVWPHENLTGGA